MARRPITPEWAETVRQALAEKGISQNALAREMGLTSASMSLILGCKQQSSKEVERISERLGIELPSLSMQDPQIVRLAKSAVGLDKSQVEMLVKMAEHFKSAK